MSRRHEISSCTVFAEMVSFVGVWAGGTSYSNHRQRRACVQGKSYIHTHTYIHVVIHAYVNMHIPSLTHPPRFPCYQICGTAYRTIFKKPDGRVANLLEMETSGPYLSLVVVTRHDTNPDLFNTKFRLNFGRMANAPIEDPNDPMSLSNALIIGKTPSLHQMIASNRSQAVHYKQ